MDKSKFKPAFEHTLKIDSEDLRNILIEALNLPQNVVLCYTSVERSDFRDHARWTEVTGIQLSYKS